MPKTTDKVSDAASTVKPYFERALHDEELRDNVRAAYDSARAVYDELVGNRGVSGVARKVASDKDLQDELRSAVTELRKAANRMRGEETHKSRNSGMLILAIAIAIIFNPVTGPAVRKWLAKNVFGESGDFTYQGGNGSPQH
jgi:hypothetical protein